MHKVRFLPHNKEITVSDGESLIRAAMEAGAAANELENLREEMSMTRWATERPWKQGNKLPRTLLLNCRLDGEAYGGARAPIVRARWCKVGG